jgi:hypothetical protein
LPLREYIASADENMNLMGKMLILKLASCIIDNEDDFNYMKMQAT